MCADIGLARVPTLPACRRAARTVAFGPDGPVAAVDPGWPTGRRSDRPQYAGAAPDEFDPAPRQDCVERALHYRTPGPTARAPRPREPERYVRERRARDRREAAPARG